ncbi:MAG: cytochrome-c peroxidase [Deltaproteobacteria bacterium]|nr:cytochrome-c peroxidase [Deltaproteobacteria bacterium]
MFRIFKFFIVSFVVVGLLAVVAEASSLREKALSAGLKPIPKDKIELMKAIGNPDPKSVELGKKLFFDTRISKSGRISCNTCHDLAQGGADGVPAAVGHEWAVNPHHLNSPTVYNSVFNSKQMWDGRFGTLEDQAKGPIQASPEMAASPELVVERLSSIPAYVQEFKETFPKEKEPLNFDNVARAIAAFERTLITPSRFDKYLRGDEDVLTKSEVKGLSVFIDKGCVQCHSGIGLGGIMRPFPVTGTYKYKNIGDFKGDSSGLVKVGLLRNISNTAPYFHNGAVWTLEEAVRIMGQNQLGIELSDKEVDSLVAFLFSLEGEKPVIIYPVLPSSTSKTPRPDIK